MLCPCTRRLQGTRAPLQQLHFVCSTFDYECLAHATRCVEATLPVLSVVGCHVCIHAVSVTPQQCNTVLVPNNDVMLLVVAEFAREKFPENTCSTLYQKLRSQTSSL